MRLTLRMPNLPFVRVVADLMSFGLTGDRAVPDRWSTDPWSSRNRTCTC
jgi:hypothetical protein